MQLVLIIGFANILIASMAVFGVLRARRSTFGHWAGLSVLVTLPLANAALLFFVLTAFPYFDLMTASGIALLATSGVAVAGALLSVVAGWRVRT